MAHPSLADEIGEELTIKVRARLANGGTHVSLELVSSKPETSTGTILNILAAAAEQLASQALGEGNM